MTVEAVKTYPLPPENKQLFFLSIIIYSLLAVLDIDAFARLGYAHTIEIVIRSGRGCSLNVADAC